MWGYSDKSGEMFALCMAQSLAPPYGPKSISDPWAHQVCFIQPTSPKKALEKKTFVFVFWPHPAVLRAYYWQHSRTLCGARDGAQAAMRKASSFPTVLTMFSKK